MPTLSPEFVTARDAFAAWYDSKDADTQELIDAISDRTYFIIEEQDYDRFIDLLKDEGIESAMDFEDKFEAEIEGYGDSQLADYAQQLIEDCYGLNETPAFIANHIDWEAVWNCELRFDYSEWQFQENTYLFRNH
jgi:hypothetical protein